MNKVPIKGTLSYLQLISGRGCAWAGDGTGSFANWRHFLQSPEISETWTDPESLLESVFGE